MSPFIRNSKLIKVSHDPNVRKRQALPDSHHGHPTFPHSYSVLSTQHLLFLVAGERRLRAAQMAGLTEIPVLFIGDEKPEEVALIENSLRQDLTAVEEAEAAGRMVNELNYTQAQLGKILGKKPQTISDILSLNRLPAEIRDECRVNPVCPRRVLVEIARKKQDRAMITLYNKHKDQGLTSDEVRQAAKREKGDKTTEKQASDLIAGIAAVVSRLEKIDWSAVSTDSRTQIQEALSALTDTFATINKPPSTQ